MSPTPLFSFSRLSLKPTRPTSGQTQCVGAGVRPRVPESRLYFPSQRSLNVQKRERPRWDFLQSMMSVDAARLRYSRHISCDLRDDDKNIGGCFKTAALPWFPRFSQDARRRRTVSVDSCQNASSFASNQGNKTASPQLEIRFLSMWAEQNSL